MAAISELSELLGSLDPILHPGTFAFCQLPEGAIPPGEAISWFREAEGVSVILPIAMARTSGWLVSLELAWITLAVHSDLAAVGLTATVASTLAAHGISCNMVAAFHHDHLFVPTDRATDALQLLQQLAANSSEKVISR